MERHVQADAADDDDVIVGDTRLEGQALDGLHDLGQRRVSGGLSRALLLPRQVHHIRSDFRKRSRKRRGFDPGIAVELSRR